MRPLALACTFAALAARAAVPFLPTSFDVRVNDASGRAVPGAFVVAREIASIGQLHGHRRVCTRADIAAADNGASAVRLPPADVSHLALDRSHAVEVIAYAPGHCIPGWGHRVTGDVALKAVPAAADEARLHGLVRMAGTIACGEWSPRSRAAAAALAKSMQQEADAIARTRYEKMIAQRLATELGSVVALAPPPSDGMPRPAIAAGPPAFARDFVLLPEASLVRFPAPGEPNQLIVAAPGGTNAAAAAAASPPPGAPATLRLPRSALVPAGAPKPRLAIHCRHQATSACDLDERDWQGRTALAQYTEEFNLEAVKLLVDAGANPSIDAPLPGADAIEAWMRRALNGTIGPERKPEALAVIDALAVSPKATLRAGLKADLEADPSQWRLVAGEGTRALMLHAREKLSSVPARPEPQPPCEPIATAPAVRLR